ncbi:MAG: fibrobacter succinogenes major paralogous domain-containing protein [Bacteroidales bacterium]
MKKTASKYLRISVFFILLILATYSCERENLVQLTKSSLDSIIYLNDSTVKFQMNIIELNNTNHPNFGVCFSLSNSSPTITDNTVYFDTEAFAGKTIKSIENLEPHKRYFIRGFVMDNEKPVYSINTLITPDLQKAATITPVAVNSISASLRGMITTTVYPTAVYFEYGLTNTYGNTIIAAHNPMIERTNPVVYVHVTGLMQNTEYHFRIVSSSSAGTSYGDDLVFRTLKTEESTVQDIDNNLYNTVIIGTQEWMVENLNVSKYNDGTNIFYAENPDAWLNNTIGIYTWYEYKPWKYKETMRAAYNWYSLDSASNGNRNVCPVGWHVPTAAEFNDLITFLGGQNQAGGKLKETETDNWLIPNSGADNLSGFSAKPNFSVFPETGNFIYEKESCIFWSRTFSSTIDANALIIFYNDSSAFTTTLDKKWGLPVRCVKD